MVTELSAYLSNHLAELSRMIVKHVVLLAEFRLLFCDIEAFVNGFATSLDHPREQSFNRCDVAYFAAR